MGAWGIKALESDEGLDVLGILADNYLPTHTALNLGEMIGVLKTHGMFGEDFEEIDSLYDNSAMALAQLYLEWLDTAKLNYDNEDENLWAMVKSLSADKFALEFLLRYLHDIKNEVPDEDDERELVELWRESDSWEDWSNHLDMLIERLEDEKAKA